MDNQFQTRFFVPMHFCRLLFVAALLPFCVKAQEGGSGVYSFLNVPAAGRVAAMGGTFISVKDNDLNLALQNPALLNPSMSKFVSLSGVTFPADIKFGDAAFAKDFGKTGMFDAYIHYASYGDFKETDITGEIIGSFKAADYAFGFGWSRQLNKLFSVGANLKGIYSDYYIASSFGIAADIGAALHDSDRFWTVSIVAKNAGRQLKTYVEDINERLPVEVQMGVSKGFRHVPLRLNLNFRHCEKWNITYKNPNDETDVDLVSGDTTENKINFLDKLARHVVWGGELSITKHFLISVAYNFQRREELKIESKPGMTGISFGFTLKVSKFMISYGRAQYHLAGASNHFTVSANLGEFIKKKTSQEPKD
jgi:hypothetical protein